MTDSLATLLACDQPLFFLIAGPNGAGKSTFTKMHLTPLGFNCINPDQIALEDFGAGTLTDDQSMAATIKATEIARTSMSFIETVGLETVFSDDSGRKLGLLKEAKELGFRAGIIFIGLNDPQLAIARVSDRVDQSGHDVPDGRIIDRFPRTFENLQRALPTADFIVLIDNSTEQEHQIFGMYTPQSGLEIWGERPSWLSRVEWDPHNSNS